MIRRSGCVTRFAVTVCVLYSLLILCARQGDAVPACPLPASVQQPDGSRVTLCLRGDESCHWMEDHQGYPVVRATGNGPWVYARVTGGVLTPTKHQVGRVQPAAAGMQRVTADTVRAVIAATRSARATRTAPHAPATGTMHNLVVLVNFSDVSISYDASQFNALLNQTGYAQDGAQGSLRDYYREVSAGALTVESTIAGPVTLSHPMAYYGGNDSDGNDQRPREMITEALQKLAQSGFDFHTLDGDGDGWVDGLDIIHAGGGEEYSGNNPAYLWSHQWTLPDPVTYDGIKMQMYHTEASRRGFDSSLPSQGITRIGVICHETGHFLGLPDLYDITNRSYGVGAFCLMGFGGWAGASTLGECPVQLSAWCKAQLGWITPTRIVASDTYTLPQVETSRKVYKLFSPTWSSSEYYLIENRQGVLFDRWLPGLKRGILIWHIDETQADNTDAQHLKVDLEEASERQHLQLNENDGDDLDYFRSGQATRFTANTTPNNWNYAGQALGGDIDNISMSGETMYLVVALAFSQVSTPVFTPAAGAYDAPIAVSLACDTSGAAIYYTLDGSEPTTASLRYQGPFTITVSTVVRARAFRNGMLESAIASASYTIGRFLQGVSLSAQPGVSAPIGAAITITARPEYGVQVLYEFWLRSPAGVWRKVRGFAPGATYGWQPKDAGEYLWVVYAREAEKPDARSSYTDMRFTVTVGGLSGVMLAASPGTGALTGRPITVTATPIGSTDADYEFWLRDPNGVWTKVQNFSSANSRAWQPTTPGRYQWVVYARSREQTPGHTFAGVLDFTVTAGPLSGVTLTTNRARAALVGTPFILTATPIGGSQPMFEFWLRNPAGVWTRVQNFSTNSQRAWQPTEKGAYQWAVYVRENGVVRSTALDFYLIGGLLDGVTLTAVPASSGPLGQSIPITATAIGGDAPVYEFWQRNTEGIWKRVQGFSPNRTINWRPTTLGSFQWVVYAREQFAAAGPVFNAVMNYTTTAAVRK